MKKAEQLVGGPVALLFSFVGVDVAHHQRYILLGEIIKARFLRQYITDHLVRDFDSDLLIEALRVIIKHMCFAFAIGTELYGQRIRKFTIPVRKNDRKYCGEHLMTQQFIKPVEYLCDTSGDIVVANESCIREQLLK